MYAHEPSNVTTTTARDEFVDPAGIGDLRFLNQRGVFGGTYFVYGTAGPPQGHVVYDPAHHIAFFDEGCCSIHHIEPVSGVVAPPKVVARRSLLGVRTKLGLRLGDDVAKIEVLFGFSKPAALRASRAEGVVSYRREHMNSPPSTPCTDYTTFLLRRGHLAGIDFAIAC